MPASNIGSTEHKALFCREFVDTFHAYEVRDLRWPELSDGDLQRLRGLPFWAEAVSSERPARARVHAMAEGERDPLLREAIAMQAYVECRHAALLESMLAHYGIAIPGGEGVRARDADEGDDFTMRGPASIGEVTLRRLAETCLSESERRLAGYGPRLLRPRLVPRLVRQALRLAPRDKNGAPAA